MVLTDEFKKFRFGMAPPDTKVVLNSLSLPTHEGYAVRGSATSEAVWFIVRTYWTTDGQFDGDTWLDKQVWDDAETVLP